MVSILALGIVCYFIIDSNEKYIVPPDSIQSEIGLVLGSGITDDGKPKDVLRARLDVAANVFETGSINKLVLSGDNRSEGYNEPLVMKKYLVDVRKVPEEKIYLDYAGRSTYESCERAAKIFGLKRVVLFSSKSHLKRAIYLCRHFDIDTYGIDSKLEANNSERREPLARIKAVYNIYFIGEKTILGDKVTL